MHNLFGSHSSNIFRLVKRASKLSIPLFVPALLLGVTPSAFAEIIPGVGGVTIPASSTPHQGDRGVKAHTNLRVTSPFDNNGQQLKVTKNVTHATAGLPPYTGYYYETPASLACIYHLVSSPLAGCNPNSTTAVATGGSKAIAIVDAYDLPTAASDLAAFSTQFNLPAATLQVVFASGTRPANDPYGWGIEEALDIEMAHSMAPHAKIILVEARSDSLSDLMVAVGVASAAVATAGGGEVSMSWGSGEWSGETSYDSAFVKSTVVFVASAGDSPGTEWPSVSPNIVSAGGTSAGRNPNTGAYTQQNPWQVTGGGQSAYEPRPSYQSAVSSVVSTHRGVPDVSFVADPDTGVWVLDSNAGGWYFVGGTSVAAPALAGIINAAGHFSASSAAELTTMYGGLGNSAKFTNVTGGNCGVYGGYQASTGYNLCTGVGVPLGLTGM